MVGNIAVFVLAIYGIFLERRRFVLLSHITLFPVFLSLIHLPMWIESRYSLPMMPLVLILAARGIEKLLTKLSNRYRVPRSKSLEAKPSICILRFVYSLSLSK